jgi:phage FluMu gp28-like protein
MISPLDILLPYQRAVVDDAARFKIWLASRQIGKSMGLAAEAARDCAAKSNDMWVVLSAGERQALEFMEKAKQWAEAFQLVTADYHEEREHSEALIKSAEIRWGNGSRMIALPANASTARGYSANLILDEFAFHDDPALIWRGIYPSISNPLKGTFKLRIASTANGKGNKFFDLWDGNNGYAKHRTTIHDAVAGGLADKSGKTREAFIAELKAGLDDPEGWAQEFECEFLDGSNVLLPYELIALAESIDATEAADPALFERPGSRRLVCGIDFGRQNDPTVCITAEEVGDLLVVREVLRLRGIDTPTQQERLRSRIAAARRTCFDYTGPGIGLGDHLVKEFHEWDPEGHKFGKVELCTFTANFKREIFPKLRRRFEAPTKIRVPVSRHFREDLHAMQQVISNGQYNYWAPRTREGHSDRCTALALAVRAAGTGGGPFAYERVSRHASNDAAGPADDDDRRDKWGSL